MSIREVFENREKKFMAPLGCLSSESFGRERHEEPCPIRTVFQVDIVRIVYSNAFRRLKHKTQVFLAPLGDDYRTRLTHTLEVAQMAKTIARAMFLNEDLAEAIALGHDLGHTPFGHSGETALKEIYLENFAHNEQSLRVVEMLEKNGMGLNLTHEVRDGILKHSKGYGKIIPDNPDEMPQTTEGKIVRIADIIAYLNHDLDDAIRSGVIKKKDMPPSCARVLGRTHWQRATTMIKDLVFHSKANDNELELLMSDEVNETMISLRKFMYDNVYRSYRVHNEFVKAKKILSELYSFFLDNDNEVKKQLVNLEMNGILYKNEPKERIVCDLIASMTDRYALALYEKIFLPLPLI